MEIGNRPDAYASGYYPLAGPQNRQAVNEVEQARAQQERQRERAAAVEENEQVENDNHQQYPEQVYAQQSYSQHAFYSQDVELDSHARHALNQYHDVASQRTDDAELMQRLDVFV